MDHTGNLLSGMAKANRALLVVNIGLSLTLVLFWAVGHWVPEGTASPGGFDGAAPVLESSERYITPERVLSAVTGKALFRTSRAVTAKQVDELSHYELCGLSLRNGEVRAYIRDTKLKKMLVKAAGDTLGAYQISEISDKGVALTHGSETVVLPKR